MNGWDLLDAAGGIAPAYLTEAEATAIRTKAARKRRKAVALAACIAAAVVCAALTPLLRSPEIDLPAPTAVEEGSVVMETPSAGNAPTEAPTLSVTGPAAATEPAGPPVSRDPSLTEGAAESAPENASLPDGMSGAPETSGQLPEEESFGGPPLPAEWSADPPVIRGTGYTEEEIAALLGRDGNAVKQMVSSETGFAPEDVRICAAGYCHTVLGAENVADPDYLILPVCAGDRVVASVDLFRVDGEIHYSVSAGGPRWDNLNRALQYGEVAFVYAGFGELAVAADGTVFEITVGASQAVAGQNGLYRRSAAPQTTYSLARLRAAEKY